MMKLVMTVNKYINTIFNLLLMLFIVTLAGCLGGGGGDDDAVDVDPVVPDILTYEIRQTEDVSLTVTQAGLQVIIAPAPSRTFLSGTFNRLTEAYTLDSLGPVMSVSASDFLSELDAELGPDVNFSDYNLQVVTAAAWVGDGNPTSGVFDIRDGEVRKITVSVNPDVGLGIAGVDIVYWPDGEGSPGTSQPSSATWDEFDALFDDDAAYAYERMASFAYSVLRFMYEQGDLVISTLEYIGDNDTLLQQQGLVTESCDTYQLPVSPTPPDPTPGMSDFTWSDDSANGELGPGDSFRWDFNQCWSDDDTDDIDILLHGGLNMVNYIEVVNADVITRIGFEPFQVPGGIVYNNLKLTETETTFANVILNVDETMTLDGGFSMVFTSP